MAIRPPAALVALLLAGAATVGAACGDDATDDGEVAAAEDTAATSFPLPFGLRQVDGTEPIGRPAVVDEVPYYQGGAPVHAAAVHAAYRVTADDPLAVLRAWTGQLDGLTLEEGSIRGPDAPGGPWAQTSASGGDHADLQLWDTEEGPILLVHAMRMTDAAPTGFVGEDHLGSADDRYVVAAPERSPGDVLFTEQGDRIHLPEGTRELMPTLPTFGGTGGSTSVLAAEDAGAAVQALLDEAVSAGEYGEVTAPVTTTQDGVEVIQAGFVIPAGGWGFDVLSVQGPDDAEATLYVVSVAD